MRLIDSTIRRCAPSLGVGRRWLRERLSELHVHVYLSEGCLNELAADAEAATWQRLSGAGGRYLDCLRAEIAARAEFIHRWTTSDEPVDPDDEALGALVRIARNYALPRPWKVPEPVAAACTRRAPSYRNWASRGAAFGAGLSAGAA
jgi:hypothetical protein